MLVITFQKIYIFEVILQTTGVRGKFSERMAHLLTCLSCNHFREICIQNVNMIHTGRIYNITCTVKNVFI